MDMKDLQYFFDGLSGTLDELFDELYSTLVVKGKKKMGQETTEESPQVSELIRRTREKESVAEMIAKGKQGQEELISAIGAEVKKILSSAGIVTRNDLARVVRRMDEIEKTLAKKGE
ncbi:MAG: hypothetical protein KKF41_16470 [Actinobacteria bacterium]|nr:hypothetical protein [Actinomycetota bacterium]MBU1944623.1 hypothetical protein [Actinomycetota bacterium]MBU2689175.1 hypothetical protein [Actinomycetota bacterium]